MTVEELAVKNTATAAGRMMEAAACKKTAASTAAGLHVANPRPGNTSAAKAEANFAAAKARYRFELAPIERHLYLRDNLIFSFPTRLASDHCSFHA